MSEIKNLYFIVKLPEVALEQIYKHVVGKPETQRRSLDGKSVVVKLPVGAEIPQAMQHLTPLSHSEVLKVMATPEWTSPEI